MLIQGDEAILLSYCNLRIRVYKLYGYSSQRENVEFLAWRSVCSKIHYAYSSTFFLYNTDNTSSEDIGWNA